jgi:hypothetical protein
VVVGFYAQNFAGRLVFGLCFVFGLWLWLWERFFKLLVTGCCGSVVEGRKLKIMIVGKRKTVEFAKKEHSCFGLAIQTLQ